MEHDHSGPTDAEIRLAAMDFAIRVTLLTPDPIEAQLVATATTIYNFLSDKDSEQNG